MNHDSPSYIRYGSVDLDFSEISFLGIYEIQ
jgi:hypothetical protein